MLSRIRRYAMTAALTATFACSADKTTGNDDGQTPPPPPSTTPVATVQLSADSVAVQEAHTIKLTPTLRDAESHVLTGRQVTYAIAPGAIATVDADGTVHAVAAGLATLTATAEGKIATAKVLVIPAAVTSITATPAAVALALAEEKPLTVTVRDDQNRELTGRTIDYTTNAPAIATVSATGVVKGIAGGNAIITVNSESKSVQVPVVVQVPVATVEVVGALDTLEAFDVLPLQAITRDALGNVLVGRTITWTVSNTNVATVANAALTGIDRGTVIVTATSEGKIGTASRVVVIKYRSVTAGTMHACDIASGGIAYCWGLNSTDGRIGLADVGDAVQRSAPNKVPGDHKFVQLVAYSRFTCGLRNDGKAYCWGNNNWGALGTGTSMSYSSTPVAVAGNNTFVKLAAGGEHACGITTAGTMLCWGHNDWGQFGRGNTNSSDVPVIAAGGATFSAVAAGPFSTCGVATTGASYCFGADGLGELGAGTPISFGNTFKSTPVTVAGGLNFAQLSMGSQFSCGLTVGGKAYCWGSNSGKLGNAAATSETSTPSAVAGGLTFRTLSSGYSHSCAITMSDNVYCWGNNGNGQLGIAGASTTAPVLAANGLLASEVAASGIGTGSGSHTCAISRDRLTAYCWGRNDVGQLGNGTTSASAVQNPAPAIVVGQKPL